MLKTFKWNGMGWTAELRAPLLRAPLLRAHAVLIICVRETATIEPEIKAPLPKKQLQDKLQK